MAPGFIYSLHFKNHVSVTVLHSFGHLDNLEKLDLSFNQLEAVGPGVFRGLSRLRQLYMQNNRLTMVQQGSLDMLPGLEVQAVKPQVPFPSV